jgi:hypothetical protein
MEYMYTIVYSTVEMTSREMESTFGLEHFSSLDAAGRTYM